MTERNARFSALTESHVTRVCDCGKAIGPGNFSGLCWDCLAKTPAPCGVCGQPVEGVTAADAADGSFTCDACQKVAAILALLDALGMPDGATCAEWLAFDLKRDEVTRLVRELRQLGGC